MTKPWSISTTVRSPERLRNFLRVLKKLEGQKFTKNNQIKYQVLLIKEKIYRPNRIPLKYKKYYEHSELIMPYQVAKDIFYSQNYEDPPMRGRQSVNPLNKLGFSIAREGYGAIKITKLGNMFLRGDYDIGFVFFKSLIKLQFPNLWSKGFSAKDGFNIMPFVGVLHLIHKLNNKSQKKGLNKVEFGIFIPTLINTNQIDEQVERILKFRKKKGKEKDKFILDFAKEFYGSDKLPQKKINNLFDYGDNIMRYFRLTRYFKITMDPLGYHWNVDLEPSRLTEINQIIKEYDSKALKFESVEDYLAHMSDIKKPKLPWERLENLQKVAISLRKLINDFIVKRTLKIKQNEYELFKKDINLFDKKQLENYIKKLRRLNLDLKLRIKKKELTGNLQKIEETIVISRNYKLLKKYESEQFEKLLAETLKIINDELLIKPNYPIDDDGEPISHAPAYKADIECFYSTFKAICEVTLNTSNLQWVQEGQPVMRHLRDFERQHDFKNIFCIFVSPRIRSDTYSQFWISVKYEYDGKPQKIVPLTTEQFALILEKLLNYVKSGKKFSHKELHNLYGKITQETKKLKSFSDWATQINSIINKWVREKDET